MEDKLNRHLAHPFYEKSKEIMEEVRIGQIIKGSEKYEEPFTPKSWSSKELVIHALQENVDQQHYIVGMMERMEEQEQTIEELQAVIQELHLRLKEYE